MAFTSKTATYSARSSAPAFAVGQRVTTDPSRQRGLRGTVEALVPSDGTRTPCYRVRWDGHAGLHDEAAFRLYTL